ncbi:MAG: GTPase ObgE [Gemmatimonadetes bacterium]|nr:GTPase ObgE [Gemmatimonadota bacterium]
MRKPAAAFVDRAVVEVIAGTGGSGSDAFRREKGVPRGGPAGGDGGRGGDVVFQGDVQLSTLLDCTYRRHYRAGRGGHGEGKNRTGRSGADCVVRVPLGSAIFDADTGEQLGELLTEGEELVVARGGRGGRGNTHFVTPSRQAPRRWEPGEEGESRRLRIELSLMADVGLVGPPNAGKSTLLSAVSDARPKVADYPFTTLEPNLGVAALPGFRSLVIADVPGIIEGAHEGRGLGHQFLRHIERTRALALTVPVDAEDPQSELDRLRAELGAHLPELLEVPFVVLLTKSDLLGDRVAPELAGRGAKHVLVVSAVTRKGLDETLEALWRCSNSTDQGDTR